MGDREARQPHLPARVLHRRSRSPTSPAAASAWTSSRRTSRRSAARVDVAAPPGARHDRQDQDPADAGDHPGAGRHLRRASATPSRRSACSSWCGSRAPTARRRHRADPRRAGLPAARQAAAARLPATSSSALEPLAAGRRRVNIVVLQADDRAVRPGRRRASTTPRRSSSSRSASSSRASAPYAGATIMGDGQRRADPRRLGAGPQGRRDERASAASASGGGRAGRRPGTQRLALLVVALGDGRRAGRAAGERRPARGVRRRPRRAHRRPGGGAVPRRDPAAGAARPRARRPRQPSSRRRCRSWCAAAPAAGSGVVVREILDIVDEEVTIRTHLEAGGHGGSAVVAGVVTELVDLDRTVGAHAPALLVSAP